MSREADGRPRWEARTDWGWFALTEAPIDVGALSAFVTRPEVGAVNVFLGTVREWTRGRRTLYLVYEAYEAMALRLLQALGEEVRREHPGARVAVHHRLGRLEIGEIAVAIAVGTPHRDAAYAGSRHIIERIKEMVPIWKKEFWEDGSFWVGDQLERIPYPDGRPPEGPEG
ncbi:MAG: molybdenum cofactor biosynthesis protein MoaE [Hydrogenibacillus schlegelii]|uniref:Molybdopterin synthase catalytic subunit n=1 Tax=Hydrogenibacillus schlegelii TaxID=1484 RepID=A0A947CYN0_HYDSH|nr:molybdenum cofactor biosynthesis protein MoaE [Hydrogenibacillus schlegelii]MBT9283579.1 molybdenum cofactor biosynthesis protein MoaE [Hydrogenibacillus schlegelii]